MNLNIGNFAACVSWLSDRFQIKLTADDGVDLGAFMLQAVNASEQPKTDVAILGELLSALKSGRKIDAIKAMRSLTGEGLKEAKDAVEAAMPINPNHRLMSFVREVAEWNGTTDSWFDLFKNFQERAKNTLDNLN